MWKSWIVLSEYCLAAPPGADGGERGGLLIARDDIV
jgi:hypothetical protein